MHQLKRQIQRNIRGMLAFSVICRNYYCVTFVFFVHFDHFEKNCYMDRWGGGFIFNKIYIDSYRLRPQSINIKCYQLHTYLECMVELT